MSIVKPVYIENFEFDITLKDIDLLSKLFLNNNEKDLMKSFFTEKERCLKTIELYKKTNSFTNEIKQYLIKKHSLETKVGNWSFRNQSGRVVPPEGHLHVRDNIYFTTLTTILGDGPWYEIEGEKHIVKEKETVVFSEELFLERFPSLGIQPVLHGSPMNSKLRLIFLCSFVPC